MWNKIIEYLLLNAPAVRENRQAMFPRAFLVRFALELLWLASVRYLVNRRLNPYKKEKVLQYKAETAERIFGQLTAQDRDDTWETMENKGFLLRGYMVGAICNEFGYEPVDWNQLDNELSEVSKLLDEMFLNPDNLDLDSMTDLLAEQLKTETT